LSITTPVMIRVSMVIPETGLVPMMAMALAATGAKRKAIAVTRAVPTRAGSQLSLSPKFRDGVVLPSVK